MFNLFKKKTYNNSSKANTSFEQYNKFEHRFVDRQDMHSLVSLKVGGSDWKSYARFLIPTLNTEKTKAFTWELKFVNMFATGEIPFAGWNQRAILIDLTDGKFQAGPWQKLTHKEITTKADWKENWSAWQKAKSFDSPQMLREINGILEVNETSIVVKDWDEEKTIKWNDIKRIHFSKRSVNTCETPLYEIEIQDAENHRIELVADMEQPFFQKLLEMELLTIESLGKYMNAEKDYEFTVMSALGGIHLPLGKKFDVEQAKLFGQSHLPQNDTEVLEAVDIGGIIIDNLKINLSDEAYQHLPANDFYFDYSAVNNETDIGKIKDLIAGWVKLDHPETKITFNKDYSTFLTFDNSIIKMELSYSGSAGFGSIKLNPEFYRKMLLSTPQYQTDFNPSQSYPSPLKHVLVESLYGFNASEIFPTPDKLHKDQLHFWKDQERSGLSSKGYLYLWNSMDLLEIQNEVSDEYSDRGGPYYDLVLTFKNQKRLTLRMSQEMDITELKKFLGK